MKKLLSLLLVVFVAISFAGCADTSYSLAVLSDGTVVESFKVVLDTEALETAGYSINDITGKDGELETAFDSAVTSSVANFEANLELKFPEIKYETLSQFRDSILVAIEKEFTYDADTGTIIASLTFNGTDTYTGIEVFNSFYKELSSEEDEDVVEYTEDYIFLEKTIAEVTPYYYSLEIAKEDGWISYFINYFSDYDMYEDTSFSYIYGTPKEKLYSDSDLTYYSNGTTYHEWEIELEGYEDDSLRETIVLYTISIVRQWWYILAIGLTIIFILVLFVIAKLKKNPAVIVDDENVIDIDISNITNL